MAYGDGSPLIGSTIDPRLFAQDFSGFVRAGEMNTLGQMGAVNALTGAATDYLKQQGERKNALKASQAQIEAAATLFPDQAPYLQSISAQLKDEDTPLSQRAAMAGQVSELINMGVGQQRYAAEQSMRERQLGMQEEAFRHQMGSTIAAEDARALDEKTKGALGPALLEQVLKMDRTGAGASVRQSLGDYTPAEQYSLANSILSLQPKTSTKAPTFLDVPATINGVQGTQKMMWDATRGQAVPIPTTLGEDSGLAPGGLPKPLQPYAETFADAGKQFGVDPKLLAAISMHETGNGTSRAFREGNNAMGISDSRGPVSTDSVESGIYQMARLLGEGQRGRGPYAGKTTIEEIGKVYAPVGAGNDPRGLNKDWSGGVAANMKRLGANPSLPVGFAPNNADANAELERQKLEGDIAKQKLDITAAEKAPVAAAATAAAKSNEMLGTLEKLEKHPGFSNLFGTNIGFSQTWIPGTDGAGAQALFNQLKGQGFLEAVQNMKGMGALSDAEGARLDAAFLGLDPSMPEDQAKQRIQEIKATIQNGLRRMATLQQQGAVSPDTVQGAPAPNRLSDADRLRSKLGTGS